MQLAKQIVSPSSTSQLRVETINSVDALEPLRERWNALVRRSRQNVPFLTYEWLTTWWRAFGRETDPQVVTVWQGDDLVGIAPMTFRRTVVNGVPSRVGKLWSNPFSNRVHVVADEPVKTVMGAVVDHWLRQDPSWDILTLEPIPLDCELTKALLGELDKRNVPYGVRESLRSPYLPLPATWNELMDDLGGRFRKTLRREIRAACRTGTIRTTISNDPEAVEHVFEIAAAGPFHDDGTSMASSSAQRQFYREIAEVATRKGWLVLAFLEHEGRPIAFEYNLYYDHVMYSLKSGYHPDFASHSPGRVLMHDILQRLVGVGGREYDFLGMDEEYKVRWTKRVRHHGRITVFSHRFIPRARHFLSYRMQPWIKTNLPWVVKARRVARGWLNGRNGQHGNSN